MSKFTLKAGDTIQCNSEHERTTVIRALEKEGYICKRIMRQGKETIEIIGERDAKEVYTGAKEK